MSLNKSNNPEVLDKDKTDNFLSDLPFDFKKRISEITEEINSQYDGLWKETENVSNLIPKEDKEFSELDNNTKKQMYFNLELVNLKVGEILEKNHYKVLEKDYGTVYDQIVLKIYLENWKTLHINVLDDNKISINWKTFNVESIRNGNIYNFWVYLLEQAKISSIKRQKTA